MMESNKLPVLGGEMERGVTVFVTVLVVAGMVLIGVIGLGTGTIAAYGRPGDIVKTMSGQTIEIINTDAEGRLVLADVVWYAAKRFKPKFMVDLATLTGAMELALGDFYAGAFANEDEWMAEILAAAKVSGDHAWPFPLHPRYRRYVDSSFADLKNASDLRQGSPVLAAEFLREFAGEGPWAHIDMAGPGFLERSRGDYLNLGALRLVFRQFKRLDGVWTETIHLLCQHKLRDGKKLKASLKLQ